MAMENGGLSASDALLLGRDGGFDGLGGSGFWIFALLILMSMFNGGFGGFGGNNGVATQAQVDRGFDTQNMVSNQRETLAAVNAGTAQSVAATNQTFHDSLAAMQSLYNETARDIAALAVGQANQLAKSNECCCDIKQLVMQSNYDGAMRDAATNANFTAQIQSVKDMIAQNKIESLQNQVNALTMQNALSGVVKYPLATTYAVPSPCFAGCGCGNI